MVKGENLTHEAYNLFRKNGVSCSLLRDNLKINNASCHVTYSNLTCNYYWFGIPKEKIIEEVNEGYKFIILIGGQSNSKEFFIIPLEYFLRIAEKYPLNRGRWLLYVSPILNNSEILLFYPRKTSEKIKTSAFLNNFESLNISKEICDKIRKQIK